jgi:YHS domain-containing protein
MQNTRPEKLIDPVCGMTVRVSLAEEDGLLLELDGRTYAFCRAECRAAFLADPTRHSAGEPTAQLGQPARVAAAGALPVIDEGIRRWYESCSCCLSDAYPEIKAQLDAERAAAAQSPVAAGICEVAEAGAEAEAVATN